MSYLNLTQSNMTSSTGTIETSSACRIAYNNYTVSISYYIRIKLIFAIVKIAIHITKIAFLDLF